MSIQLEFRHSLADLPAKELAFTKMPPELRRSSMGERRERLGLAMLIVLPYLAFSAMAIWLNASGALVALLVTAFVYWALVSPMLLARQGVLLRAKSMQRLPPHNSPVDVRISDEGIDVASSVVQTHYNWAGYSSLVPSASGFFLWFGLNRYVFIPKTALPEGLAPDALEKQFARWRDDR